MMNGARILSKALNYNDLREILIDQFCGILGKIRIKCPYSVKNFQVGWLNRDAVGFWW